MDARVFLCGALAAVVDRIKYIVVDGLHTIPIIPPLLGLTRGVVLQIGPGVNFIANIVVEASPVSNFHFIICVERGGIKGVDIFRIKCSTSVSSPQVAMDQTRLDASAVTLERSQ